MEFYDNVFWHADSTGQILWNASLQKGWTASISWRQQADDFADAVTPYSILHKNRDKEAVWERIRATEFPDKPTRLMALFLFVSRQDADRAMTSWFAGQNRRLFQVLVPATSSIHIADTMLLNAHPHDWEANARKYWNGELTDEPFLEAVLFGPAFIPNIQQMDVTPKF